MTTTERKQELRRRGEELLKARELRIAALRKARGVSTPGYEVSTVEREIRSLGTDWSNYKGEQRSSGNNGMKTLKGVAIVYNSRSHDLGGFREIVRPGAFTRSLTSKADVVCLRDHDNANLLGRTSSGTLTLTDSPNGLSFSCPLPATTCGQDVQELCSRGDLQKCSFGFVCQRDDYDEDLNGEILRTVLDADLFDVSVVSSPAYEATCCSVRSLAEEQERMLRQVVIACHRAGKPVPHSVELKLAQIAVRAELN
jgi:HK97 family phage prohead protease